MNGKPPDAPAWQDRPDPESLMEAIKARLTDRCDLAARNLDWLRAEMPPYFFITMREEQEALLSLASNLDRVARDRKLTLLDREDRLILARRDQPGSLYRTLRGIPEPIISYAEAANSHAPLPGSDSRLEVQKFEFSLKTPAEIAEARGRGAPPAGLAGSVRAAMEQSYPRFDFSEFDQVLRLIWLNNPDYATISPPLRTARVMWIYQQARRRDGLFCDLEPMAESPGREESRLCFAVGNPPAPRFLAQVMEVFNRLDVGVRRFYALNISTQDHRYFLGTFYAFPRQGGSLTQQPETAARLKAELYNTQILDAEKRAYRVFVAERIMTGEEASLAEAFVGFCHTALSHNQPDRFDQDVTAEAFYSHPGMALSLIELFRLRFDPQRKDDRQYERALSEAERSIEEYNTGHRRLDQVRRTIYRACLLFIRHCLKTNFFAPEKHALAFRLDPAYLGGMDAELNADLPPERPFRVTFFFSRYGLGYHIGFSDIARGGWRTIICRNHDEYLVNADNIFREVYVLAHTQHLKNKDIYEGGSKLGVVLDARGLAAGDEVTQRLYKLQYGIINAFFDIFVTENGRARDPRVVDYYGDDEPIELGPDENMHDSMVEYIARQAERRGYLLGIGVMSSKKAGINHKEYGVTSRGVVKMAEIALRHIGLDMAADEFSVRLTGGPRGDVAGNALLLLLERCPRAKVLAMVDGSGGAYDPQGLDHEALGRLIFQQSAAGFDPQALSPGGCILHRRRLRQEELRELHCKVVREQDGLREAWITSDEFHRELDHLVFAVPCDLFLPCGGRPETMDDDNWPDFFSAAGQPSARVAVEGANSFITEGARLAMQEKGVIILRDASANKCGVISSSYEIIANLLMSPEEFLEHKEAYAADVLKILDKRAQEEADLIFRRHGQCAGAKPYTEISSEISREINQHYSRLFDLFQANPELGERPLFQRVMLNHLPAFVREREAFRARCRKLPAKIRCAILASEIASFIVYQGGWDSDLEGRLIGYLTPRFPEGA